MKILDIILIGIALSMDAFAAAMTDGMREARMRRDKLVLIVFTFGLMQCGMPVLGYFLGSIFTSFVERFAPLLSFAMLAFVGGKAVLDFLAERTKPALIRLAPAPVSPAEVAVQGVATSLDALAVGVTFLAAQTESGLPMSVFGCSFIIGAITFSLSLFAVLFGRKLGVLFADKAKLLGGCVLIGIGIKLLIEGA